MRNLLHLTCLTLLLALLSGLAIAQPSQVATSSSSPLSPQLTAQIGHSSTVSCVAFSPDGQQLLTRSDDGTARLWDVSTGELLQTFQGHTSSIETAIFAPDGQQVLTGSDDKTAGLWDVRTGKLLHVLQGYDYNGREKTIAFSPDSRQVLISGNDNTAHLLDAGTGKLLHTLQGNGQVNAVAFSPDGKQILTGSGDNTARLWDDSTGKLLHTLQGHKGSVDEVAFSPDGQQVVTTSSDDTARLWDTKTGKLLHVLQGHNDLVTAAAFSPDGKQILTGSSDGARLWDAATGNLLHILKGHTNTVWWVAFSPDGKQVLTGSSDHTARLWDASTGKLLHILLLQGHNSYVSSVAFSPDGKQIATGTGGRDTITRLWDASTGLPLHTLQGHDDIVSCVELQRLTGGSYDFTAHLGDAGLRHTLQGYTDQMQVLDFSPDGSQLLTGGSDHTVRLWDTKTGRLLRTLQGHTNRIWCVTFSPNGQQLLTGSSDRTARVWDSRTGKLLHVLQGHTDAIWCATFSPDNKQILTGSDDKTARLWEAGTGKLLHILRGHPRRVSLVAFSPDGKQALTGGSDDAVQLWDTKTGRLNHTLLHTLQDNIDTWYVAVAAFSPDGKQVLTGGNDAAWLWNASTGKLLHILQGHTHGVWCVAFSPDGKQILTGGDDHTARLWDAGTGKLLHILQGYNFYQVAFSSNGQWILTNGDGTIHLWKTATGKELCSLLSFDDGTWAVTTPDGRYDASNGGDVPGLHYVVGLEPIDLSQLKERYYEPGLLAKLMGFDKRPLRNVQSLRQLRLYPEVETKALNESGSHLEATLRAREGGFGPVQVLVNGSLYLEDARPDDVRRIEHPAVGQEAHFEVEVSGASTWKPGGDNQVQVIAYNDEGWLSSRASRLVPLHSPVLLSAPVERHLYAIVCGISNYAGPSLHLRFADRDAQAFASALSMGAQHLFGATHFHLQLLGVPGQPAGSKTNLKAAFDRVRHDAKPDDILVVYLSGHGAALPLGNSQYCYLTQDATGADVQQLVQDSALREATTVSSAELATWIAGDGTPHSGIAANYRVMVLDTCAAGAAGTDLQRADLSAPATKAVDADQVRAMERFKDRTGFHVLMGCAPDRVSYESSRYGQGVLTYALLQGMKGAKLRENQFVDVRELFSYAEDTVPALAGAVGGLQQPRYQKPDSGSFDIGRLDAAERGKIHLDAARPQILQAQMGSSLDGVDDLGLEDAVRSEFLRRADLSTRGGVPYADALSSVYVDATTLSGALRPIGQYYVQGNAVIVTITLVRDNQRVRRIEVRGSKNNKADLARRVVTAIDEAAFTPLSLTHKP